MLSENQDEKRWDAELKHKERLFVLHFCTDDFTFLNATQSYKCVYKERDKQTGELKDRSNEVCQAAASRLLAKSHVKKAVSMLLSETQADLDERNGYKLLKNLMLLSDFNPADIVDSKGRIVVKDLKELGEYAKCIQQIETTKAGFKVTLVDRSKYMQMYLRYLNLIKPEVIVEKQLKVVAMVPKAKSVDEWNAIAEQSEEVKQ